jgi:hypothetical protein
MNLDTLQKLFETIQDETELKKQKDLPMLILSVEDKNIEQ